jgi:hypothetical protein
MDNYVPKPFTTEQIRSALVTWLTSERAAPASAITWPWWPRRAHPWLRGPQAPVPLPTEPTDEALQKKRLAFAANSRLWFPHLYLAGLLV